MAVQRLNCLELLESVNEFKEAYERGEISGGGPNVLNDNGIIKKEHLPDGYPYLEVAEILPETSVDIDPDTGMGLFFVPFALSVGGTYTVKWNGTEYSCVGQEISVDGIPAVAVGNAGAFTGGDLTEEPFAIINFDADTAAAVGAYGMLAALDGSVTATVAISGTLVQKISKAYLPKMDGVSNIVDGKGVGSLRSVMSAEESGGYVLGTAAVAEGIGTIASGEGSHAEGSETEASGMYSHAEGYHTTASSYAAHAEGSNTTASDDSSHAEGANTTASSYAAHAEGYQTTASGNSSHTEGYQTTASGMYSHAEGYITEASGYESHAEGWQTTASGDDSHAEGYHTTASGDGSHAEGGNTIAASNLQHVQGIYNIEDADGKYAHIVGNGKDISNRSNAHTIDWEGNAWFAGRIKVGGTGWDDATDEVAYKSDLEGLGGSGASNLVNGSAVGSLRSVGASAEDDNYTIGEYAVALGNNTEAEGEASHAEGKNTTASGLCSHAEGNDNTASGVYSHTEGNGTVASGHTSHAEGSYTRAIGVYSHSEGVNSIAKGPQSHAEGYGTIAAGQNQHAQGKHNIEDTENKYVHIVGNGDSSNNRSNAHTIDWDGNGWFAGTVEGTALILSSPNGTRFKITASDSGVLSATEVTE